MGPWEISLQVAGAMGGKVGGKGEKVGDGSLSWGMSVFGTCRCLARGVPVAGACLGQEH